MSKSKKNVVDPAAIIFDKYRRRHRPLVHVLSDSPPERDVEWTASGAEAAFKHLVAHLAEWPLKCREATWHGAGGDGDRQKGVPTRPPSRNRARRNMTMPAPSPGRSRMSPPGSTGFAFNTSVAKLYGFTNTIAKSKASPRMRAKAD